MNRKTILNAWDRVMVAIAFAEAGESETAIEIMNQESTETTQKREESKIERREGVRPDLRM